MVMTTRFFDAAQALKTISKEKCSVILAFPEQLEALLSQPIKDPIDTVKTVLIGKYPIFIPPRSLSLLLSLLCLIDLIQPNNNNNNNSHASKRHGFPRLACSAEGQV
jgi:hypothetical protein